MLCHFYKGSWLPEWAGRVFPREVKGKGPVEGPGGGGLPGLEFAGGSSPQFPGKKSCCGSATQVLVLGQES